MIYYKRFLSHSLIFATTLSLGACGLREKREQAAFDRQMERQEVYEEERTDEQMIPLNQRENAYQSLRGRYTGTYERISSINNEPETVTVVAELIPHQMYVLPSDPKREMSAAQAIQSFRLSVYVTESAPGSPQMTYCMQEQRELDLKSGLLTIGCVTREGMKRTYTFYLDSNEIPNGIQSAIHMTPNAASESFQTANSQMKARSTSQIQSLLSKQVTDTRTIGLKIFSDPSTYYFTQLGSKIPL